MKIKILTTVLIITVFTACKNTPEKIPATPVEAPNTMGASDSNVNAQKKNLAVLGAWKGTEWLYMGNPSGLDPLKLSWIFNTDGTYIATYGDEKKTGSWRTNKDSLYTLEPGKKEIPIKLLKADGASLDMEMSIKGKPEVIKLIKQ